MEILRRFFYFFTPYTDIHERAVGNFFRKLDEHGNRQRTLKHLQGLLQNDIAVINLWTEYRYKGYRYLRKSQRRKLYANLQLITGDFDDFYANHAPKVSQLAIRRFRVETTQSEKAILLQTLMDYFSPQRGTYEYRESSSFGRLLQDPSSHKLIGDCNQIVTLYIYLYSRYYNIRDLQLRTLPGHVALHYNGIDIETTTSLIANYSDSKSNALLPIEEIVSINLLDTNDTYLSTHTVAAEDILHASRLAFILSHDRAIVTHNLQSAYAQLVNVQLDRHNFHAARQYAQHLPSRNSVVKKIWQSEGAYYYNAHHYHKAITAFKRAGNQEFVQHSYQALFFEEQAKLGKNLTSETIKQHTGTIKHMRDYAKKSGNKKLIKHADALRNLVH